MWEYQVRSYTITERWGTRRQSEEIAAFTGELNQQGMAGWDLVGYESVPLLGGMTGKIKGYAYLLFFKRLLLPPPAG